MKTGTSDSSVSVLEGTLEGKFQCVVSISKKGKTVNAEVFCEGLKNGSLSLKGCSLTKTSEDSFIIHKKGSESLSFSKMNEPFFKPIISSATSDGKDYSLSEAKMRDYMFANPSFVKSKIQVSESYSNVGKEFVLDGYGRIDVLGKDDDGFVIIEFKKKRTTLGAIDQTRRYADHFESLGHRTKAFLFVRKITKEHEAYAREMGVELVTF